MLFCCCVSLRTTRLCASARAPAIAHSPVSLNDHINLLKLESFISHFISLFFLSLTLSIFFPSLVVSFLMCSVARFVYKLRARVHGARVLTLSCHCVCWPNVLCWKVELSNHHMHIVQCSWPILCVCVASLSFIYYYYYYFYRNIRVYIVWFYFIFGSNVHSKYMCTYISKINNFSFFFSSLLSLSLSFSLSIYLCSFCVTRFVTHLDKKAQSGTRETANESVYGMESNWA